MADIERLAVLVPAVGDKSMMAGPDHPMRVVTREVAFDPVGWTPERSAKVAELFDALAPGWHTHDASGRDDPLLDALARGNVPTGRALELGSGTGFGTRHLVGHFTEVVALDLSMAMLALAPPETGVRVQGDAVALPVADDSVDAVVLVNALLFPAEVDRVLRPGGVVVWVNTIGDQTPIHLPADDVAEALPGEWAGVESEASWGTWTVLHRSHSVR